MKKLIKNVLFVALLFINIQMVKAADYIWPIKDTNAYETYIEYGYGVRTYDSTAYDMKYNYAPYEGIYSRQENHYGVDITGIKGNTYNVVSVVDGTVLTTSLDQYVNPSLGHINRTQRNSSFDGGGYGNYIVIKENSTGLCFLYAHLQANSVTLRNGDRVTKGQVIGTMGSSGDSGHMHLHFEVRLNQNYTTTGKNLIITTKYGLETLDPTKYIGTKAPEKPVEQVVEQPKEVKEEKKETPKETQPVVDNKKATVTSASFEDYYDFGKLVVTLDKELTNAPKIDILISNEGHDAHFIGKDGNKYIYTVVYSDFDIVTYGKIIMAMPSTELNNMAYQEIGYLNEYTVAQTYEDSYYYRLGDVNKDGRIDAIDASQTLSLYSKLVSGQPLTAEEQDQKTRADMNKDGYVDSIDASLILNYYAKMSTGWTLTKQEKIIRADVTGDHVINNLDYSIIKAMAKSGQQTGAYNEKYDLNKDGKMNNLDELFFKDVLREYGSR